MSDDPIPAEDLVTLAARRGLLDEPTVRAALGGRTPTVQRIVERGVRCARCGGAVVVDGSALACPRCRIRVSIPGGAERYERRRKIGQGGFGEVWLAYDRELDREVAVKYLTSLTKEDVARFKREAKTAALLSHPGIVRVHDVGEGAEGPYIVMEYVRGSGADEAKLELREAVEVVRQAAEAVAYAHEQGVVHRDLKPANLLVTRSHGSTVGGSSGPAIRALVSDFGLAKNLGGDSSISVSGDVFGTPSYMPPEQARGRLSEIGPASDVYSLGATAWTPTWR